METSSVTHAIAVAVALAAPLWQVDSVSGQCTGEPFDGGAPSVAEAHIGAAIDVDSYQRLLVVGGPGSDAQPGLAQSWVVSGDPEGWQFGDWSITASDGVPGDRFGASVAAGSLWEVGLIGAPGRSDSQGAAYVFSSADLWEWQETDFLTAPTGQPGDEFGAALDLSDYIAAIGAPGAGAAGRVYLFQRVDGAWSYFATLSPSDGSSGDRFGSSVYASEDVIFVGAPHHDDPHEDAGAVYLFVKPQTGWTDMTETVKWSASDAQAGQNFGGALGLGDLYDAVMAVGAPAADAPDDPVGGAVYLFDRVSDDWTDAIELVKVTSPEPSTGARFGQAVSVRDGVLAIGAPGHDGDVGRVYLYLHEDGSWQFVVELVDSDATSAPRLGSSLAIMRSYRIPGQVVVAGAPWDDRFAQESGFYSFYGGLEDCQTNGVLDICDVADGTSNDDNTNGQPDECDRCPGDLDGDGWINQVDLGMLLASYELPSDDPNYNWRADVNSNGAVDQQDLGILLVYYDEHCPFYQGCFCF